MNDDDVKKLVDVRSYVIECHNGLDGANVGTSVVKQADVAYEYTRVIQMIDNILKPYVNFD